MGRKSNNNANARYRDLIRIRNAYILLIAILVPEFWVGMTINLEVNLPAEHFDVITSLTYYAIHFNLVLWHIAIAIAILVISLVILAMALTISYLRLKIGSIIVFTAVIGAIVNGILFLTSSQFFGNSIGMAMSAVSVLVSSAILLYYIGYNLGRLRNTN